MDTFLWLLIALAVGFLAYLLYTRQLKWLLGVAKNSALGIIGLLLFNFFFGSFGLIVGINVITVLTVGLLGAPGFLLLYATQLLVG
jgi:inhibitor of the pro-sigma K processing machinery